MNPASAGSPSGARPEGARSRSDDIAVREADAPENGALTTPRPILSEAGWQSIETAPKDRTVILAKIYDDLFPRVRPNRADLEPWNGRFVTLWHAGILHPGTDNEFDMGWNVAAPVGNVGIPDDWIEGWQAIPLKTHLPEQEERG